MTVDAPLVFPSSRVLAGWWQQIAPLNPFRIWIAHLRLHRIEAPFGVVHSEPLDRFTTLLLECLRLQSASSVADLNRKLHLGPAVVLQLLRGLGERGLACASDLGEWSLTPAGRQALADGRQGGLTWTRRVLHFVDNACCNGAPHFLNLQDKDCTPCEALTHWQFPRSVLEASVRQSLDWKAQHGFPADIHEIPAAAPSPLPLSPAPGERGRGEGVALTPNDAASADWRRVVIDRPGALLVACVLTNAVNGQEELRGYAIRPESWTLRHAEPVFRLGSGWRVVLPGLALELGPEVWGQAWAAWCHARGVSLSGSKGHHLEKLGFHLRVPATKELIDRLRPLRGEAWLLSAEATIREAVRVELVETR